jgi:drug/metabolite transporter (DMT)-like permease
VWAALWVVYIVWGSTYLAIRVMVRTMPPLLASGMRFLVAGLLMCGWFAARRGLASLRMSRRELMSVALIGLLLPAGGNGLVTVAEKHVPSGLTALIIASVPLWVVVFRLLDRQRVARTSLGGVAVGFVGVALLLVPGGHPSGVGAIGVVLVLVAALSWASGSFLAGRLTLPRDPLVATGVEMVAGGLVLAVSGLVAGEASSFDVTRVSGESLAGFVYLVTIGAIVAYSAYVWLLQSAPISRVSTYAYVNPVIAILLGWAILSEQLTLMTLVGAAVIVASVAAIVRQEPVAGASSPGAALRPGRLGWRRSVHNESR